MVLVGYHSTDAYKLYDPKNKKEVFLKDERFDESRSWHWKEIVSDKIDRQFYFSEHEDHQDEAHEHVFRHG